MDYSELSKIYIHSQFTIHNSQLKKMTIKKKNALGRGLGALLSDTPQTEEDEVIKAQVASINEISLGAGIGTFISVFPTFGFGTLLVLFLSRFVKFNLIAAVGTSMISNPFTSPFFMISSFNVGSIILGSNIYFSADNWKQNLSDTGKVILIGSFVVSGALGLLAYFISKIIVTKFRKKM